MTPQTPPLTPRGFKEKRKELGLTTRQLANELGLSPKNGDVYIRKIESGASDPSGLLIKCFELYCQINQPKQQGE
jgi:predicted transcriptional regulator